jgi:hypothetical protein
MEAAAAGLGASASDDFDDTGGAAFVCESVGTLASVGLALVDAATAPAAAAPATAAGTAGLDCTARDREREAAPRRE